MMKSCWILFKCVVLKTTNILTSLCYKLLSRFRWKMLNLSSYKFFETEKSRTNPELKLEKTLTNSTSTTAAVTTKNNSPHEHNKPRNTTCFFPSRPDCANKSFQLKACLIQSPAIWKLIWLIQDSQVDASRSPVGCSTEKGMKIFSLKLQSKRFEKLKIMNAIAILASTHQCYYTRWCLAQSRLNDDDLIELIFL